MLTTALTACSDDEAPPPAPGVAETSVDPDGTSAVEIPRDLGLAFEQLLDRRAAALLAGDRVAFASGLSLTEDAFATQQAAYFTNVRHLPITRLSFELNPRSLVRSGDDYWGVVEVALQLDGFDSEPVVTLDRYRFSPMGDSGRRFALSSVTDADWESRNSVSSQPWDDGPIEVRSLPGVLGIFDEGSVGEAGPLVRSVQRGIGDVAGIVPYDWSDSVVVYALSDTDFLNSIEDPPGDHPERLDGLAFPVETGPSGDQVASTRFVLHPRLLDRPGAQRDRLIRHELTHVAIGEHDDHAPVWLSEGLAEYVSVRALAPEDRLVSDAAVAAARGGLITELPEDATFNGAESEMHYAVAWWACEYLAATFGEGSLWTILDELEAAGAAGTTADRDARLDDLTGINSRTLARKAAKQMIAAYEPTPEPTAGPETASEGSDAHGA